MCMFCVECIRLNVATYKRHIYTFYRCLFPSSPAAAAHGGEFFFSMNVKWLRSNRALFVEESLPFWKQHQTSTVKPVQYEGRSRGRNVSPFREQSGGAIKF
uniref:Uncharacterized protein n=1 Tax=Rhipicephalus zambeziensis TaxID=60191 RepID=A0A224YFB5_9ACAR